MIGLLIKILLPIVVGYIVVQKIKSALSIGGGSQPKGNLKGQQGGSTTSDADVIEICPDCGHELGRRHRCRS